MALTDNPNRQQLKSRPRRAVGATKKSWSDSQKIEAVTTYLMLGNLAMTAATLKIPEQTMRNWFYSQWWKDTEAELKIAGKLQLNNRLKGIVERSLDVVSDRLEHGDWIYDQKTGELHRKPVNLAVAHKVASDLIDKQEKLQNSIAVAPAQEAMAEKMLALAEKFAALAERKPTVQVTDVIYVTDQETDDAVHEERETGLQEGVREVPQPTGADQEPDGTDDRSPTG